MNRMKRILSKQGVAGLQWPLCWNLFKLFKKPQTIWRHLKIFIVYSRNILLYKIKYILLKCSRNLKQWGHLESLSLFFFFLCFSLFFVAVKIFCWFSTKLNNMYIMEKVQIYIRQLDKTQYWWIFKITIFQFFWIFLSVSWVSTFLLYWAVLWLVLWFVLWLDVRTKTDKDHLSTVTGSYVVDQIILQFAAVAAICTFEILKKENFHQKSFHHKLLTLPFEWMGPLLSLPYH